MNLETLSACPLCGGENIRTIDTPTNICECEPCGYVFDNPRPAVDELIAFYSQPTKYDSWLAEEKARDLLWERRLKLLLRDLKPGSLLDVGAGIGQFLSVARPHFSSVCGTEVSESAIEIARKKYGLELLRGELQAVDFGTKQFDNITVFHVLEHVPDARLVIERCTRLLVPGGVLVIAVPNDLLSLRTKAKKFLRAIGVQRFRNTTRLGLPRIVLDGSIPEIHLSHFTPVSLQRLVERCGLSVMSNTLDPYYVASGLAKWAHGGFYGCCRALNPMLRANLYDTILVLARKDAVRKLTMAGVDKRGDRVKGEDI
jgi:SAM-dependent methyltransferase